SVFDEMQELALAACGERIMFLTGLGSTESAPMAIARMWQSKDSTNMGVPVPGVELKLVPTEGKLEARLRGPNIMPGYWPPRDVVIAGADRDEIGALIFPNLDACRKLAASARDVTGDARVRDELRARLTAFARTSTGSSNRVCRAILLGEPPSLDAGEMTDKGSINQRAVLERRADLVTELYAPEPSPRVLVLDEGA